MNQATTDKHRAGYQAGIISVITNTLLFVLKLWAGMVTGSVALTADAWHTLSDSISSIIVVVATKLSSQKPDDDHPFGHGRWEQISALFIAFLLSLVAYNFLADSIVRFQEHTAGKFGTIAIVVTIISIVVKEVLAQYSFRVARRTNNLAVRADGWHHRTDALSSVVVLVGILFASKLWWIDSALGVVIALMLFYATFEIAKEAITKLLGEKPDPDLVRQINEAISNLHTQDLQAHHFHIHNYTSHQELTFHIRLNACYTIEQGHRIAELVEDRIDEQFGIHATIHVDPLAC